MTKIEELEQKLEVLAKELATLKEESKETPWEPKGGDWYITLGGRVVNNVTTAFTKLFGLEFQTKKEAEIASKVFKRYHLVYQLALELNEGWTPNWEDTKQSKWSIWFKIPENTLESPNWTYSCDPLTIYFKDKRQPKKL